MVARLLVQNNESEEKAATQIGAIYDRVQRQVYWLLAGTLGAILLTSLFLIRSNRLLFSQLASLSEQRSELAQKLIATQESTLRHISRELHDEFGQILTAIGVMLGRAGNQLPKDSQVREDLQEVREAAQGALEKVRSLSQALHPVMIDEAGLEPTLDWYLATVQRQTGIALTYEKRGSQFPVDAESAIHVYRVVQEALNNVVRHSGVRHAWVRLQYRPEKLELEVEDHGSGFDSPVAEKPGIGLVAMRERSELLGGSLEFTTPAQGGTLVRLIVPKHAESNGG
jgi:signal transduction histidine kinase